MQTGISKSVARFFFLHLGSFVAVVVYFRLCDASKYSSAGVRSALVTALLVHTGYVALAYPRGEQKYFDYAIWSMFAVGIGAAYLGVEPLFRLFRFYSPAILFATLDLAAIVPLVLGRKPFTHHYAVRQVPRWQTKTREFRLITRVMALYWALIFAAAAALCAYSPRDPRFTVLFANLVIFVIGIPAQWWLPPLILKLSPPRFPDSVEPLIMGMPMAFNAEAARDAQARIQFQVSGAEPGNYWLRIADGKCESFEGVTDLPDLTVYTPDTIWVDIVQGKLDGAKAIADGLLRVQGDYATFASMPKWFPART